jgi:hypothetical protein
LARELLNLELLLERHGGLKFGGLFCGFFSARDLSELFFKNQGSDYEILEHGLITGKSRDLSTK